MLVIVVVTLINVNFNSNKYGLSDVSLANVEALAKNESGDNLACWKTITSKGEGNLTHVTYCPSCSAEPARGWSNGDGCKGS